MNSGAPSHLMAVVRVDQEVDHIKHWSTLVSFLYPLVDALAKKNVNSLAMDMIPRISRAQTFDALRSGPPIF